jgi:hypothetical protein
VHWFVVIWQFSFYSSSCSFGKKLAHQKEQEAASQHVGSGAGKHDEPIGYCAVSLNEMARLSSTRRFA